MTQTHAQQDNAYHLLRIVLSHRLHAVL